MTFGEFVPFGNVSSLAKPPVVVVLKSAGQNSRLFLHLLYSISYSKFSNSPFSLAASSVGLCALDLLFDHSLLSVVHRVGERETRESLEVLAIPCSASIPLAGVCFL